MAAREFIAADLARQVETHEARAEQCGRRGSRSRDEYLAKREAALRRQTERQATTRSLIERIDDQMVRRG